MTDPPASPPPAIAPLSRRARYAVLFAAIGGLLFDGVELGLMPVASLSVSQSLLGEAYTPIRQLLRPPLLRLLVIGILLGSIPMVGAWAASKWMIPWADKVGGTSAAGYKAVTQGWWALGAMLGSFFGAQIAAWLGRRRAYALISAGATALTSLMFLGTAPLQTSFLPIVFAQGFVATLFFGWLPLYLLGLIVIWWAPDTAKKQLAE